MSRVSRPEWGIVRSPGKTTSGYQQSAVQYEDITITTLSSQDEEMESACTGVPEDNQEGNKGSRLIPPNLSTIAAGEKIQAGNIVGTTHLNSPASDTFVTYYIDKEKFRSRFLILPFHPKRNQSRLVEYIEKGGGVVIDKPEESQSEDEKRYLIKILDLEYVKSNISDKELQSLYIPYDTFSSSFIWSQIYLRSFDNQDRIRDADLNLYRISPTAHCQYNANGILHGKLSWDDIPMVPSRKLSSTISVKHVALQLFPELLLLNLNSSKRRTYSREESQLFLDMVCAHGGHDKVHSVLLYEKISALIPNRSKISLRQHFRQQILPRILAKDGYFKLSDKDFQMFENAAAEYETKVKRGRKKKAQFLKKEKVM